MNASVVPHTMSYVDSERRSGQGGRKVVERPAMQLTHFEIQIDRHLLLSTARPRTESCKSWDGGMIVPSYYVQHQHGPTKLRSVGYYTQTKHTRAQSKTQQSPCLRKSHYSTRGVKASDLLCTNVIPSALSESAILLADVVCPAVLAAVDGNGHQSEDSHTSMATQLK